MKTTIGGDRLGSGNKQNVSLRNYSRSTHDLSYTWRSSMAAGTLVPFMSLPALSGDSFDIDLDCEVLTLPTIGPLFGSFKVQLDVFTVPIRCYNAALHMNKLGIGMDMSKVFLPRLQVPAGDRERLPEGINWYDDNAQVNPSSIYAYLGIRGNGYQEVNGNMFRAYNAVPYLGYWEIFKQYYANKQEDNAYVISVDDSAIEEGQTILSATLFDKTTTYGDILNNPLTPVAGRQIWVGYDFDSNASEPDASKVTITVAGVATPVTEYFDSVNWLPTQKYLQCIKNPSVAETLEVDGTQRPAPEQAYNNFVPRLKSFPLENIDKMREKILQAATDVPFYVNGGGAVAPEDTLSPYNFTRNVIKLVPNGTSTDPILYAPAWSQEGLALKTYQSDLFNNWISTEWIDGANGINAVTAVDTTGDSFTIDSLNLANKVYNMLNRIAISGGSYDDWLDAVYTHERTRSVESPVYQGSLIKQLAFQEVISNADTNVTVDGQDNTQPLGTLAGKGRLTSKNKGGRVRIKVDEPSYIISLVSLTPLIDYSQGNSWDVNLNTMNDFHKPALDGIGYQDLITEQMHWASTSVTGTDQNGDVVLTKRSAGKQPAWINYMTAVNKTYGNFAEINKEMFMTLNRRYEVDGSTGAIADLTTYIDPSKHNFIFSQTSLDAQNFWVQISAGVKARRKMSAKIIPNL